MSRQVISRNWHFCHLSAFSEKTLNYQRGWPFRGYSVALWTFHPSWPYIRHKKPQKRCGQWGSQKLSRNERHCIKFRLGTRNLQSCRMEKLWFIAFRSPPSIHSLTRTPNSAQRRFHQHYKRRLTQHHFTSSSGWLIGERKWKTAAKENHFEIKASRN